MQNMQQIKIIDPIKILMIERTKNKQLQLQNAELGQALQVLTNDLERIKQQFKRIDQQYLNKVNKYEQQITYLKLNNSKFHLYEQLKITYDTFYKISKENYYTINKDNQNQNYDKNNQLLRQIHMLQDKILNNHQNLLNFNIKLVQARTQNTYQIGKSKNFRQAVEQKIFEQNKKYQIYELISQKSTNLQITSLQSICIEPNSQKLVIAGQLINQDKILLKLQRININLQKDYKVCQQKYKNINREMSKLKLESMKQIQQFKKKQYQTNYLHQKQIQQLKQISQTLQNKIKLYQINAHQLRTQRQSQKIVSKSMLVDYQNRNSLSEMTIKRLIDENQKLKVIQQINSVSILEKQKYNQSTKDFQTQKTKNLMLQKQLQIKNKQFEKQISCYEQIIQQYKKLNNQEFLTKVNIQSKQQARKMKKNGSSNKLYKDNGPIHKFSSSISKDQVMSSIILDEKHYPPEVILIFKSLKNQINGFKQQLKCQNSRYNVLEDSNRQLRKQLIRMIEGQEILRKNLINEKVKSRTNSNSSRNIQYNLSSNLNSSRKRSTSRQFNKLNTSMINTLQSVCSSQILGQQTQNQLNKQPLKNSISDIKYSNGQRKCNAGYKEMREKIFNTQKNLKIQYIAQQKSQPSQPLINQIYVEIEQIDQKFVQKQICLTPLAHKHSLLGQSSKQCISSQFSKQRSNSQQMILQISSSQSCLSKDMKIKQLSDLEMSPEHRHDYVDEFSQTITRKTKNSEHQNNYNKNNFVKSKIDSTKSYAQMRFTRKNFQQELIGPLRRQIISNK